jgi:hypothetical protein
MQNQTEIIIAKHLSYHYDAQMDSIIMLPDNIRGFQLLFLNHFQNEILKSMI